MKSVTVISKCWRCNLKIRDKKGDGIWTDYLNRRQCFKAHSKSGAKGHIPVIGNPH